MSPLDGTEGINNLRIISHSSKYFDIKMYVEYNIFRYMWSERNVDDKKENIK